MQTRILIVDDEPAVARAMRRALVVLGYDATVGRLPHRREHAVDWALRVTDAADVVVCDWDLGAGIPQGPDLLEAVAAAWPRVARVLHTGRGGDEDQVTAVMTLGLAHAYLGKPAGLEDIGEAIKAAMRAANSTAERG